MTSASDRPLDRPPYRLVFRPLVVSGMLATDDAGWVILVDNEQSREEQTIAFCHELVHTALLASGQHVHDEAVVDDLASRMARACPDLLDLVRPAPTTAAAPAPSLAAAGKGSPRPRVR